MFIKQNIPTGIQEYWKENDLQVCNIFIKNNVIQKMFTKQNIPTEIHVFFKKVTGDFTLW